MSRSVDLRAGFYGSYKPLLANLESSDSSDESDIRRLRLADVLGLLLPVYAPFQPYRFV